MADPAREKSEARTVDWRGGGLRAAWIASLFTGGAGAWLRCETTAFGSPLDLRNVQMLWQPVLIFLLIFFSVGFSSSWILNGLLRKGSKIENTPSTSVGIVFSPKFSIVLISISISILLIVVYYISTRGISNSKSEFSYTDLIVIILTSLGVILTTMTIFLAVMAVVGYGTLREEMKRAVQLAVDARLQTASTKDVSRTPTTEFALEDKIADEEEGS